MSTIRSSTTFCTPDVADLVTSGHRGNNHWLIGFASSFLPHTGEAAPVQTGRIQSFMQYIFLDVFLTVFIVLQLIMHI